MDKHHSRPPLPAHHPPNTHLRRGPTNKSVSSMHPTYPNDHRVRHGQAGAASTRANPPPPAATASPPSLSSKPSYQKDSSGESSNAEKWFEASNNNVPDVTSILVDNDPPFFLRHSSSSDEQSPGINDTLDISSKLPSTRLPFRADNLFRISTGASSSDDYRSVIDDLTIQNKRLKRKLKKYEKLHDSHLQDDKLFEIRVHSLPADKKKELEDMLRKFTMTLRDTSHAGQVDQATGANSHGQPSGISYTSLLKVEKTSSSHASTRFGDSAYASMSASGQNSIAASGQGNSQRTTQYKNATPSHQQSQNILSYLQDVPAGLIANNNVAMTEKAKRKLVVRRLEQIFAGKGPAAGSHQQPLQQQEVAQSAARADRKAIEASGQRVREEGTREAQIMPNKKLDCVNHMTSVDRPESRIPKIEVVNQAFGQLEVPEQRPTRPLDLDPYRAQIPADNIEYIRHLGFSPIDTGSTPSQQDGHGWIYLNLLTNMAQLHTINVTADFIRNAIANYSKKLELSSDGRKVRWRGGADVTKTSSDSSPEDENRPSHPGRLSDSKQGSVLTTAANDGSSETVSSLRCQTSFNSKGRNKLAYTPLFFHQIDSEDEYNLSDENASNWSFPQTGFLNAGNSSVLMSSGMRTTSSRKRKGDDGPIIFYNKANFCTDLSGDPRCCDGALADVTNYTRLSTNPVGVRGTDVPPPQPMLEKRGPLSTLTGDPTEIATRVNQSSPEDEMEIQMDSFKPKSPEISPSEESPNPIEFEASGIGGVLPQDNFTIRVKSRRKIIDDACSSTASKDHKQPRPLGIPPYIRTILASPSGIGATASASYNKSVSLVEEQILSSRRKDLPPSELPPASFFPFGLPEDDEDENVGETSEGSGDESDVENSESSDASAHHLLASHRRPLPATAPQLMTWPVDYDSGSESEEEDNNDDDDDEEEEAIKAGGAESVNLLKLVTAADPSGIPTGEKEHDANIADRLAVEIPAGSSAATAGGGSGFSSPNHEREKSEEDGNSGDRNRGGGKGGVGKRISLKRARTSESVVERVNKSPRRSMND